MRPLRYSTNITLDGCADHNEGATDPELHAYSTDIIRRADALIFGRTLYEMMEGAFRQPGETGIRPEGMAEWVMPFAKVMSEARKYVVSDTLQKADWNAEIVRGAELEAKVRALKAEPGGSLYVSGLTLPRALIEWGLIDEFELLVHPRIAGHGPWLFAGLSKPIDLRLVNRREFGSGAVALTYVLAGA